MEAILDRKAEENKCISGKNSSMWNKTLNLKHNAIYGHTWKYFLHDLEPRKCKSIAFGVSCLNSRIFIQLIWKTTKFYFGVREGNLQVNILDDGFAAGFGCWLKLIVS